MKIKSKIIYLFPFLMLLAFACRPRKADYSEFNQFYAQFMQDSLFQVQHINFPLEGIPDNASSYSDDLSAFRWTADNWRMHRPIDFAQTKFEQNFQTIGDELIIENLSDPQSGYGMIRRWAKLGGEWSLIYYAGINPIR